jgi:hypothetical protein
MCSKFITWLTKFSKKLQLSRYHHQWFGSIPNLTSASPSIHRNVREKMSMRWLSIMIGHVGLDRLIIFIS